MTEAITLMEAYLIEYPQFKGMSKKELLQHLRDKEANVLEEYVGRFDYSDLVNSFIHDEKRISQAIQNGYSIKFVSIMGIQQLLHLKFGLEAEHDFDIYDDKVLGIPLTERQYKVFEEMLSPNWKMTKSKMDNGKFKVNVIHNTKV